MSKEFIPSICGDDNIYIPQEGCDDCDKLEARVKDLEDTRLVQSDIIAGEHIIIDYAEESNEVTVNADLSNYYDKASVDHLISQVGAYVRVDELPEIGDTNKVYLVPLSGGGFERWIYTEDDGWIDLGDTQITIDKQAILNALDYRETTIRMIDENGTQKEVTVLVSNE